MKIYAFLVLSWILAAGSAIAAPTALTVQSVVEASAVANLQSVDSVNGNKFLNSQEDVLLVVQNTHASNSATVTITAAKSSIDDPVLGTVSKAGEAISLAATAIKILGPFPRAVYNDSTEFVSFAISGTGASSVKALPFRSAKLRKIR